MPITRICLLRHGETEWNTQRRWQGHEDIPLNRHGELQAHAAAEALQDQRLDIIYTSDLNRAKTTARLIADACLTPLVVEPELRERHFGAIQGLTRREAEERYPSLYSRIQAREPDVDPPGRNSESLGRFARRIGAVFRSIAVRHPGKRVLIVSHGGCMDIMYRVVTGMSLEAPRNFALGNATINWVSWQEGQWQLREWDKKAHLVGVLDEISA